MRPLSATARRSSRHCEQRRAPDPLDTPHRLSASPRQCLQRGHRPANRGAAALSGTRAPRPPRRRQCPKRTEPAVSSRSRDCCSRPRIRKSAASRRTLPLWNETSTPLAPTAASCLDREPTLRPIASCGAAVDHWLSVANRSMRQRPGSRARRQKSRELRRPVRQDRETRRWRAQAHLWRQNNSAMPFWISSSTA